MNKIKNLPAKNLVKALKRLGYEPTRQTGSHIRLTTQINGEHHVTIPNHSPLKIGTAAAIIGNVAQHFNQSKEEIIQRLFE
ncbi:MAG: type II toxin-antitoxin system HicA family toxin [Chitinophagales bacterium]|nr:type II toxin-antitoxin system HicA family toxin [Chitinophagales bacterium]